ncbi:MAG: T9SS type A sorting domain-containing protein, partial [Saprospiraceae bacterium]
SRLVVVSPLPAVIITGSNVICINEQVTLTASGATTYSWSNGSTGAVIQVSPSNTTTYTVTATDANGCSATQTKTVTVNGLSINVAITGDTTICLGGSTTLTASGGISYTWSNNATTASITVSPLITTIYTVTATDANGCKGTASRTVIVRPRPLLVITGDTIVCNTGNATFAATGGLTYLWSTGATTASITVSPVQNTTYTVTATDANGCTNTASTLIKVRPLPTIIITGPNVICINEAAGLKASGANTYLWSTGATTDSITVSPAITTTYTVTATDISGCTATQSKTVTVNGLTINVNVTGNNILCLGDSTVLKATGGISYLWSNGSVADSIKVKPTATTTYTVTATDVNGCRASSSRTVTVNNPPIIIIDGDISICKGDSSTLTAIGGATYLWSTNETTASIKVKPMVSTSYTVTATNALGCRNTASIFVTVDTLPIAVITGNNLICRGDSTDLTASGGVSYLWSTGATTPTIRVAPLVATTYTVTVTSIHGCTSTAARTVTLRAQPVAVITGSTIICPGDSTTLKATGGVVYVWSTGATTDSIRVSPAANTTYSVTVTDINGCKASSSASVQLESETLTCTTKNYTAYLGPNGSVTIIPSNISTGSAGGCGNVTAVVTPNQFFCNDVGVKVVTLTVTNTVTNQSLSCTAQVTVTDTIKPTLTCPSNVTINCDAYNPNTPLSTYGVASVTDNCLVNLTITELPIRNLNICNIGQITRTFTATDNSGNTTQCVQLISVINPAPLGLANIVFPKDTSVSNCGGITPSITGNTIVNANNAACSRISVSFVDNIAAPKCAAVVLRTWTVIDSCLLIPGTNSGIFTKVQTITVFVEQPVITGPQNIQLTLDPNTCMAALAGSRHAASGCNLKLSNSTNGNPNFDLTGNYPAGQTTVTLTAVDSCSNLISTFNFVINVIDTSSLRIECFKAFPEMTDQLTVVEPVTSYYSIFRSCGDNTPITGSFSNLSRDENSITFGCADVGSILSFPLYFYRNGETQPFFSCNVLSRTLDPNNFCGSGLVSLDGNIQTEANQTVADVTMKLDGSNMTPVVTNAKGNYSFGEMSRGGDYDVSPIKDIDPLDGVSTLDLIHIQKHILKTELLTSPYKLIAADINKDDKITVADITQLRKLILGINSKFTENTSWRMVDKTYVFPDPKDPFMTPFVEKYHINNLNSNMKIDWVGVKIGDVNDSYISKINGAPVEVRESVKYFSVDDLLLTNGLHTLPVMVTEDMGLQGFQISLKLDHVSTAYVTPALLPIEEYHYSFHDGVLNISWHHPHGVNVNKGEHLFNVQLYSDKQQRLSDMIQLQSKVIKPELYDMNDGIKNLILSIRKSGIESFRVVGNTPNPWKNETSIQFYLPEDGEVSIKVRDLTGRMVYSYKGTFYQGDNKLLITKESLGAAGIYLYDVTYKNEIKSLKMLNIH